MPNEHTRSPIPEDVLEQRSQSGVINAQRLLMHRLALTLQQSAVVAHASFSPAHVSLGGGTHSNTRLAADSSFARQNPSQHCTPDEQLAPLARHGASAAKARMLPVTRSWPGR